ncbi:hypothetical protein PIB30_074815 [Stylosanthes scabra]|uniref:Uncharacterized protein n=1 Tax=Stylosanthes scabra TaxID=79078 RepID=A0ABU6YMB3_9FABA|nr:hypothetical protein [Stylosanthes scabra]
MLRNPFGNPGDHRQVHRILIPGNDAKILMLRNPFGNPEDHRQVHRIVSSNNNQVDAETKGDLSSRSLLSEFKSGHDLEWCCLGQEESRLRSSGVPRLRLT